MMMHKPHFPEIMTETLGGGYRRRERELGVWGLRETWVSEWGHGEGEKMRARGSEAHGETEGTRVQDRGFLKAPDAPRMI